MSIRLRNVSGYVPVDAREEEFLIGHCRSRWFHGLMKGLSVLR